jgi:phenylacetic acid degradation operon negative regulatory protein
MAAGSLPDYLGVGNDHQATARRASLTMAKKRDNKSNARTFYCRFYSQYLAASWPMDSKTDELICMLLWTCEALSRPTFRNLTESFESWAYRNGLLRQLQRLEKKRWIERSPGNRGERYCRLSEAGRLHALGGRDPEVCWHRRWDGRWRLAVFDVPEAHSAVRHRLRRYLRRRGFGCLQNSVWISANPLDEDYALIADSPVDVEALILLEARPCGGETDAQIVAGAWDFEDINRRYASYQTVLDKRPRMALANKEAATAFYRWFQEEREAWADAVERDPLLPESLWPSGYLGHEAWHHRLTTMAEAGRLMRAFNRL